MEAVVFTGIQGAGKSAFYRERFFHTHVRISLDMLRTRYREEILVRACLMARQPFVVDNTNVRVDERAVYIRLAKEQGFRVVGYFFRPELRASIARNLRRTGKQVIPVKGLAATYKRLQPPALAEGFDEIFAVSIDKENAFVVSPWPEPEPAAANQ